MNNKRKGQIALIFSVLALTLYNILPTLFYYAQPLKDPIDSKAAQSIAASIEERVETLEEKSLAWLSSYCDLLNLTPRSIERDDSGLIALEFANQADATRFRTAFPHAGSRIPAPPEQLFLAPLVKEEALEKVWVLRRFETQLPSLHFTKTEGPDWDMITQDRLSAVRSALGSRAEQVQQLLKEPRLDSLLRLAQEIDQYRSAFGESTAPFRRFVHSLGASPDALISLFDRVRDQIKDKPREAALLLLARSSLKHAEKGIPGHPLFAPALLQNGKIWLIPQADLPQSDSVRQLVLNEIGHIAFLCDESAVEDGGSFSFPLSHLPDASGALVLNLEEAVKIEAARLSAQLPLLWQPKHPDLQSNTFPLLTENPTSFCLWVSPSSHNPSILTVTLRGIERLGEAYKEHPDSLFAQQFSEDLSNLSHWLGTLGFRPTRTQEGIVFERADLSNLLINATREQFHTYGSHRFAVLELSNYEQRLLTVNRIETALHEELVKWQDEYRSNQVNPNPSLRFLTPKPPQSVFWDNFFLNLRKYFRGDERKILRWGLDLSGGKSIQIELQDQNHQVVTDESDIRQGINELYSRVNKLGVSEVTIRKLGNTIVLDFPGVQALSASDLVRGSSMTFHVVDEKFSSRDPIVNGFLQGIWNEAVATHRTGEEDLQAIANRHLENYPIEGLSLNSHRIVALRGASPKEWYGQPHPLLVLFAEPVLEGAHLEQVHPGYDPSRGNFLSFSVKSSFEDRSGQTIDPRVQLHRWTSRYAQDAIVGTELEQYTDGHGWRMAVLLNGTVISAPTLSDSSIRDGAQIHGSFSPREVAQLASDLKAGSLTFTPRILSETNVSPELGQADRIQGIAATLLALVLVIGSMVLYYRFAGWVASVAVLINLLIIWAVLQNIGATLSLAGIAGIILTVGMAVDANVLVFERMKEELALTSHYASALNAGYRKAFSAILDSNLTTILAALILLNFDAGPIKGFALTLIIGIASSMFTALFLTRVYFEGNPNRPLRMSNWIRAQSFDFLKRAPLALFLSLFLIVGGGALLIAKKDTLLGMDFTGGYSVELMSSAPPEKITEALKAAGLFSREMQIRSHAEHHHRLLLSPTLEQEGRPFASLSNSEERVTWITSHLQEGGVDATASHWTSVSGQMSETMRNSAVIALGLAFASIFIYLVFRFESKFAASALLCLFHDVLITLGLMGILHACGFPIQIDLNTVAAIMTIIGYSLNDTIIIFDRIREEIRLEGARNLPALVNRSLNTTLSRTSITSGTTLLVLLALVFFGGPSLFNFSLVMTIGVVFGTLSSWFIASPLFLFFHRRAEKRTLISNM